MRQRFAVRPYSSSGGERKQGARRAGISETRADRYMGHSNPSVQARYRHQLEGQLAEDAERLDAYLAGAVAGKVVPLTGRTMNA